MILDIFVLGRQSFRSRRLCWFLWLESIWLWWSYLGVSN